MNILILRADESDPPWRPGLLEHFPAATVESIVVGSAYAPNRLPDVVVVDAAVPAAALGQLQSAMVGVPFVQCSGEPGNLVAAVRQALAVATHPVFVSAPSPIRAGLSFFEFPDTGDAASMRRLSGPLRVPPALTTERLEDLADLRATSLPQQLLDLLKSQSHGMLGHLRLPGGQVLYIKGFPINHQAVAVYWEDVTEQKRSEVHQRSLDEQMLQTRKMEAITRLAGGVAHDFNNLMTAIMGYSDLIMSELDSEDPLRPDVLEIQRATERATHLTRQLSALNPHRISQARKFDLNELVPSLQDKLSGLAGRSVTVTVRPATAGCTVLMDVEDLEQVLVNLLMNAKDAMPDGGKFSISLQRTPVTDLERLLTLGLSAQEYVLITVTDTGHGMDAETRSRIFEPFYTTRSKSRGLGLTTVYGIIKTAEGAIEVNSQEGGGSTLIIYLPACADAPREAVGQSPRRDTVILLAEDEEMLGELMERILKRRGFRVLSARNGAEALKVAQEFPGPIDLLITDVMMPQVSGTELAERLRQSRPQTKVLFISGYTDARVIQRDLRIDLVDFMHKPFTPQGFDSKVQEVLVR